MSKFTAALNVEDSQIDGHITLCFCDCIKSKKFSTFQGKGVATVTDIEYWERVDLTVMLVDCPLAEERQKYYHDLGYTYDYEFIPHISLGKGDKVSEYSHFKGEKLIVGNEYARLY